MTDRNVSPTEYKRDTGKNACATGLHWAGLVVLSMLLFICSTALAQEQQERPLVEFSQPVDLSWLQTVVVQHRQVLKTLDTYARQMVYEITGKSSIDGKSALFTTLDLIYAPDRYESRNIIKIKSAPLRKSIAEGAPLPEEERRRIASEGTISMRALMGQDMQMFLNNEMSRAAFKARAVQELQGAMETMFELRAGQLFAPVAFVPPGLGREQEHKWISLMDMMSQSQGHGSGNPANPHGASAITLDGLDRNRLFNAVNAMGELSAAWRAADVGKIESLSRTIAETLPTLNPGRYPSDFKRSVEVIYNRLQKLTLPASAFYFLAFVTLVISATTKGAGGRKFGLIVLFIGLSVHTLGIAIRWWLISGQHNSWFDGIPIKNQFESVMFSAWFGALIGYILELKFKKSLFGAASSFIGWLSLTAIFATPYVTGTEIGGEIEQVQGVLMSYWLYIHVTMVTASYALIGMTFLMGAWWLVRYYGTGHLQFAANSNAISADAASLSDGKSTPTHFLATLDLCNMVILQLAFWILGIGIVLGAIWADQSWGRPWGWDPKETFALLTWIIYLIVVHVRMVTQDKAWWTSVLSVFGFAAMLFNWVGVNFFLSGLHSYA